MKAVSSSTTLINEAENEDDISIGLSKITDQYVIVGHRGSNQYEGMTLVESKEVKPLYLNVLEWLSKK